MKAKILCGTSILAGALAVGSPLVRQPDRTKNPEVFTTCGLNGTIESRIKDCNTSEGTGPQSWDLVSRSENGLSVWFNKAEQKLWSAVFKNQSFYTLKSRCESLRPIEETGGIQNVSWQVPSLQDLSVASRNGISKVHDDLSYSAGYRFWVSDKCGGRPGWGMLYNPQSTPSCGMLDNESYKGICVAKISN